MDCLDEETILAFGRGDLPPAGRARAEQHLAECDECRSLVSAVVRSSAASFPPMSSRGVVVSPSPPDVGLTGPANVSSVTSAGAVRARTVSIVDKIESERPRARSFASVAVGELLAGKYRVEALLGEGEVGVVVRAQHLQTGRPVALSFLASSSCEVPGAVARFLKEGRDATEITSPHAARVLDTGVLADGVPFLVVEYVDGIDLVSLLAQRGPLPVPEAVGYVLQACEAVAEAHQRGLLHRDLQPSKLLVARGEDGRGQVKVLDFGISRIEGGPRPLLSSDADAAVSARYRSPEQLLSARDVDVRSDVWGLGATLYELVTATPPWRATSIEDLCEAITTEVAPPLGARLPGADPALAACVARCLAKAREDRFQTVTELAEALAPLAPTVARDVLDRIERVRRGEVLGSDVSARARQALASRSSPEILADVPLLTAPSTERRMSVARSEPPRPRAPSYDHDGEGGPVASTPRWGRIVAALVATLSLVGLGGMALRATSAGGRAGAVAAPAAAADRGVPVSPSFDAVVAPVAPSALVEPASSAVKAAPAHAVKPAGSAPRKGSSGKAPPRK